jgi:hypothetical protein
VRRRFVKHIQAHAEQVDRLYLDSHDVVTICSSHSIFKTSADQGVVRSGRKAGSDKVLCNRRVASGTMGFRDCPHGVDIAFPSLWIYTFPTGNKSRSPSCPLNE